MFPFELPCARTSAEIKPRRGITGWDRLRAQVAGGAISPDAAIEMLRNKYAAGRLSLGIYEERVEILLEANRGA